MASKWDDPEFRRQYQRDYRAAHPGGVRRYNDASRQHRADYQKTHREERNEYQRLYKQRNKLWRRPKFIARKQVWLAKQRKELKVQPCQKCHSVEKIHAHHSDYSKPLDVTWLCQTCHSELHRQLLRR